MLATMCSNGNTHSLLAEMQNGTDALEDSFVVSSIFLPYNSALVPLGIYTMKLKASIYTKTYAWIFTAVLFIFAETWK